MTNSTPNSREKSQQPIPIRSSTNLPLGPDVLADFDKLPELLSNNRDAVKATLDPQDTAPKDRLSIEVTKKVISDFAKKYETTEIQAIIGITKLTQDGGTNTGKSKLVRTVNNVSYDISVLRNIIKVHSPTGTVRQLAKALRDTIAVISLENSWPGPLLKELQRSNPSLPISSVDAIYCSEIHTDNYGAHMPARIREALQQREQKLREERSKSLPSPKPNGKKKKKKK